MAAKTVQTYIDSVPHWRDELTHLRGLCRETDMEETIKWSRPSYGYGTRNLVAIGGFKAHFCLWFHEGVHLDDPRGALVNVQPGKTQSMRQFRMESARDIDDAVIRDFLRQTTSNAKMS